VRVVLQVAGIVVLGALLARWVARGLGFDGFGLRQALVVSAIAAAAFLVAAARSRRP